MMSDDTTSTPQGMSPERVVAVVALMTSSIAILSFTYDWGYFRAMGVTFATAPTSISDHMRSGLDVASVVIPMWLIVFAGHLLTLRIEKKGGYFDGLRLRTETLSDSSRARRLVMRLIFWLPVLFLIVLADRLFGDDTGSSGFDATLAVLGVASVLWLPFVAWVFNDSRVRDRFSPLSRFFAGLVPLALLISSWFGFAAARMDIASTFPMTALVCQVDTGVCAEGGTVRVYRPFGEWILAGGISGQIVWLRSSEVHVMRVPTEPNEDKQE